MKKLLIISLLIFTGCIDQELKNTQGVRYTENGITKTIASPLDCPYPLEPKSFFLYQTMGSCEYGDPIGCHANMISYPVNSLRMVPYVVNVTFKNLSNYKAKLYLDGVYQGAINANSSKVVSYSMTCNGCTDNCPFKLDTTFYWYITPYTGTPCLIPIELSIITTSPNAPTAPSNVIVYNWNNPLC